MNHATITQLTKKLEDLARPSNIRYGTAIFKRDGVEIIESTPTKVEAWVGGLDGSQRRRTTLSVTTKGLQWRCTESAKKDLIFCKHCVALALALQHSVQPYP